MHAQALTWLVVLVLHTLPTTASTMLLVVRVPVHYPPVASLPCLTSLRHHHLLVASWMLQLVVWCTQYLDPGGDWVADTVHTAHTLACMIHA